MVMLAGCVPSGNGDAGSHRPGKQTVPVPTSDDPIEVSLQVGCSLDPENALRAWCDVHASPPSRVDISFAKSDGTGLERIHSAPAGATEIGLYIMAGDTDYRWEATVPSDPTAFASGEFTTDIVPEGARVSVIPTGVSSANYFLMTSPCLSSGVAVVITPDGEVVWYQRATPGTEDSEHLFGVSWTEDNTVLVGYHGGVTEVGWMGDIRFRVDRFVDFTENIHHDAFKRNGHIYVLFHENVSFHGETYSMDGLVIFDDEGVTVADWRLQDVFQPPAPQNVPGVIDYTHSNAVFVAEDGDILLSIRHLSAVAKIDGDLTSPDFGQIIWRLGGDENNADFGTDFLLDGPPAKENSFAFQHNVHWLPDGRMAMFDNRAVGVQDSRLLVLDVDETTMVAEIDDAYDLGKHCRYQGSAWHTAQGNPVATCAPANELYEFTAGVHDEPVYEAVVYCAGGSDTFIPRFVPVTP